MMSGESAISSSDRPYTVGSFQNKLNQFQDLMKDITLQDVEATPEEKRQMITGEIPVSILHKCIAGRYRPVRVADGPITARCRFIKNAS